MIQRIQSVYLLATFILLAFVAFRPIAEIINPQGVIFEIGFQGLKDDGGRVVLNVFPLSILISLCLLISFATLFLYKKRMLQIRLCILNIFLMLGLVGLMFFYVHAAKSHVAGEASYSILFVFPIIGAILTYLALRAIARDEALVRSLDRLR